MSCDLPTELNDRDLLAYLDGEADTAVADHVARCPHCRERAGHLAALQRRMAAALYRGACPTPQELGEYHLGLLPAGRAAAARMHLAACPLCAGEVAQLNGYLADLARDRALDLAGQVREWARVVVARLVSGGPRLAPAYAPVRGGQEGPRLYEAEGIQVTLDVQDDPAVPGGCVLLGLVTGAETAGWTVRLLAPGAQAQAEGAGPHEAPVDDLGNFYLEGVAPGARDLVLAAPGLEIRIEGLDIAPSAGPSQGVR